MGTRTENKEREVTLNNELLTKPEPKEETFIVEVFSKNYIFFL